MILEKLCLVWFFLQDKSILTDARSIYTVVGSTFNLKFKDINIIIRYSSYRNGHYSVDYLKSDTIKYDIVLRPSIIELQIKNVTTNTTGQYWIDNWERASSLQLSITNMSCPSHATKEVCVNEGSSALLTFLIVDFIYYRPIEEALRRRKRRPLCNFTLRVDLNIYNVTPEDEGSYRCPFILDFIKLQVSKVWFINQTDLKTIVGQEGETLDIICSSDPDQYITSLKLKSNGTIKAIGDNQTVSFSFIPDRTDHRRKFQCVDSNHSSIMVEVELTIKYAPAVTIRYMNGTIECDCDGVPPIYSMYRLNRISQYGEPIHSVNLDNSTFIFKTDQFPYQRNGRYMCVVSNGIPNTNGQELQNSWTHVNYEGYDIFIEIEDLDIDDFQTYCITVTNDVGASEYYFAITKNEDRVTERKYVFIICIVCAVLFVSIIVHVAVCLKCVRLSVPIHSTVNEDRYYHTHDEIGTISYGLVRNVRPSETNDNQSQNLTQQHAAHISNEVNVQSFEGNSTELNADLFNDDLPQRGVPCVQVQHMSFSTEDTNIINEGQSSEQNSQTSDSESSQTVMEGNVGDGYGNPYQTVLQDHQENHKYTQITIDRNTSIVSADSDFEMQFLETSLTKEGGYINLQF